MKKLLLILALLAALLALPRTARSGFTDTVYATGFTTANLLKVDPSTGVVTVVYTTNPGGASAAMAQRASDGMIYYIAGTNGNDSVYSWNPATPATAPVLLGTTGAGIPYCPRMFCAPDGTLYAVSTDGVNIYTVSTVNGAATLHATLTSPVSGGGDIAYGIGNTIYQVSGTNLSTIPINGGAVTSLGNITGLVNGGANFTGMAIDIFGNVVVCDDHNPGQYYSVNTTTLVATHIGANGQFGLEPGDLASAPRRAITGTVFEDVTYGGGAGRTKAASSGVGVAGARVELFDSGGAFIAATVTDASGNYTLTGACQNTYTIRVVNSTVPSSRTGYVAGLLPVQTYRTNASTGTPVDVIDRVGGESPNLADAVAAASGGTLAALTTASATPQSITTVAVGVVAVAGVNFGFNFDAVVNTNNTGQGSLRQFITNANALSNTGLAQSGLTAGIENAIWMISNGSSSAGLRSGNNFFTGSVATIAPTSALPAVTDAISLDGSKQPGFSSTPVIELSGASAGASSGLTLSVAGSTLNQLCIDRWGVAGVVVGGGTNTLTNNFIGTTPAGTAAAANAVGLSVTSAGNLIGTNGNGNIISGNTGAGLAISGASNSVKGNLIGVALGGSAALANGGAGVTISTSTNTIGTLTSGDGNVIANNGNDGVFITAGTGNSIRGDSFFDNVKLPIDLNGAGVVVPNNGALGAGANAGMNYPIFTGTTLSGTTLTLTGYVGSAPGQAAFASATVDIYKADNSPADQNGAVIVADGKSVAHGEGRTYLGTLTANASGNISGSFAVAGVTFGDQITAIATSTTANTSEFGPNATITPLVVISGTVYNDTNQNGVLDGSETGTGLTLYAKIYLVGQATATQVVAVTPATGAYSFSGLASGNYTIVINQDNVVTNLTPSYPAAWTGIEQSTGTRTPIAVASAPIPNLNFGLVNAVRLTGTVFNDNGAGAGTANDGVKNGTEAGLIGVTVTLTDSTGVTVYNKTQTDGAGAYVLYVPSTLAVGTALKVTQTLPSSLLATGGSAGASGGTYTRATNTVAFTTSASPTYTGLNFGDVTNITLSTDGQQASNPGTEVLYAHTFTAGSAGTVTFSVSNTTSPAAPAWSSALYQDTNANGKLDSGEPVITAPIAVVAGQVISLIEKVYIPANAPLNAQDRRILTATMAYTNASPALTSAASRTDLTTVGTSAGLSLGKSVDKATAKPGDTLTYTITYSNTTTAAVSSLSVSDSTPAFSTFFSVSNGALPTGLTGVSVTNPSVGATGAIKWTFTGSLPPGGSGTVTFKVIVDQ